MKNDKITVARLWHRYKGDVPSRAPIMLGIDPDRYETIFIYIMKSSDKPNYFEQQGKRVYYISPKKFLRMFDLPTFFKLVKIFKNEKVDILHCHMHQATNYGTMAAMAASVPVVLSHVHGISRTKNKRRKLTNSFILKRINKILTVGNAVRNDVIDTNTGLDPEKVVSIGNSIDFESITTTTKTKQQAREQLKIKADSFVFGNIARLSPHKGHEHLIRAFAEFKKIHDNSDLLIIGSGPLKEKHENTVRQMGMQDSIHVLGFRDDVPDLLGAMDAYLMPSTGSEGLPRALMEAMAAGVPCIGSTVGGIPELLKDGKLGILIEPNDEGELLKAMKTIFENKGTRQQNTAIQEAKRMIRDEYNHKIVTERLESIYDHEYKRSVESK